MSSAFGTQPRDEALLELKAEELVVAKRKVTGTTVLVSTVTRSIEHEVDEALTHEHVDVERVAIGRFIETVPQVREEDGVTIVPVVEEVVVVERRLFLKEEVRITRKRVEARHVETTVLRRQEVVVTRSAPGEMPAGARSSDYQQPQTTIRGTYTMEHETIVAIYETAAHAQAAVRDLEAANVPASDISQHAKTGSMTGASHSTAPVHEKGFWASLFGGEPDHDTSVYGHSINDGATVVSVKVAADRYDEAAAILEKHDPIDVDERSERYGLGNTTAATPGGYVGHAGMTDPAIGSHDSKVEPAHGATEAGAIGASGLTPEPVMATGSTSLGAKAEGMVERAKGDTLQLAEEFLNVGKRAVRGGTTRIRRYTVEKPVEENVSLHRERIVLDRRPVTDGRVLANADFTDKTISMTETNEEAIVSKTARVVEEIGLHKEAGDRVETVRDTLRKDDVEVEQVPTTERLGTERLEPAHANPVDPKI